MSLKIIGLFLLGVQSLPIGKFDLQYNQDWCYLVIKDGDKVVFSADASTMVQTGQGNIDDQPSSIIVDGNIQWWPRVMKWSNYMDCPEMAYIDNEASFVGFL